jgi:tetratricopeptide (TPR) repeat protein
VPLCALRDGHHGRFKCLELHPLSTLRYDMLALRFFRLGILLVLGTLASAAARADDVADVTRLLRSGQAPQAMVELDRLLAARPKDAALRFLKGVMLSESQRTAEAVSMFKQLNQDHPDLPEPYNNLAVIYSAQGDYAAARTALEAALVANPSYALAHLNMGEVQLQLARLSFLRAAQLEPTHPLPAKRLALLRTSTLNESPQNLPKP